MKTKSTTSAISDDPIAEIHEIRRRLAARHGNDPRRYGEFLRQRRKKSGTKTTRVQTQGADAKIKR